MREIIAGRPKRAGERGPRRKAGLELAQSVRKLEESVALGLQRLEA